MWRRVKQRYNASGPLTRRLLVAGSVAYLGRHKPISAVARMAGARLRAEHGQSEPGGCRQNTT